MFSTVFAPDLSTQLPQCTTPSVLEYTTVVGTSPGWRSTRAVPHEHDCVRHPSSMLRSFAIIRAVAITQALLESSTYLIGEPRVMTRSINSGRRDASSRAYTPPRLCLMIT